MSVPAGRLGISTRAGRQPARSRPMGDAVQAKIFFITLAVDDLNRSVAFYRDGLGWPTEGIVGQEFHDEVTGADGTIAFFNLDGGLLLGLYERANLAKDAGLPPGPPSSAHRHTRSLAMDSAESRRDRRVRPRRNAPTVRRLW